MTVSDGGISGCRAFKCIIPIQNQFHFIEKALYEGRDLILRIDALARGPMTDCMLYLRRKIADGNVAQAWCRAGKTVRAKADRCHNLSGSVCSGNAFDRHSRSKMVSFHRLMKAQP